MVSQEEGSAGLDQLRAEYVVRIRGQLRQRKDPNPRLPTGMVELIAQEVCCRPSLCQPPYRSVGLPICMHACLFMQERDGSAWPAALVARPHVKDFSPVGCAGQVTVLNAVATKLPFLPADEDTVISEEVRLRTRVLDLRCASPLSHRNPALIPIDKPS